MGSGPSAEALNVSMNLLQGCRPHHCRQQIADHCPSLLAKHGVSPHSCRKCPGTDSPAWASIRRFQAASAYSACFGLAVTHH